MVTKQEAHEDIIMCLSVLPFLLPVYSPPTPIISPPARLLTNCNSYFAVAAIRCHDQCNFRKKESILAYDFREVESITAGKAWQTSSRTRKLADHISNSTQKAARQNRKVTNPQSSPNSNVILIPARLHLLRVL